MEAKEGKSSGGKHISQYAPEDFEKYFKMEYVTEKKIPLYFTGSKGPIMLCLHGAGFSALTFAVLGKELKSTYRVMSFDFRGHGNSPLPGIDFSIETLVDDTCEIIGYLAAKFPKVSIIVVGHSMGGAVAAKAVQHIQSNPEKFPFYQILKALVVIDVVEGSAIEALKVMDAFIESMPKAFPSITEAIKYNVTSGTTRCIESAKISTPSTLIQTQDSKGRTVFNWKTDLTKTRPYWEGWYAGLSKAFLSSKMPKQLVLAGADRLDTELTIAHMQGKFNEMHF